MAVDKIECGVKGIKCPKTTYEACAIVGRADEAARLALDLAGTHSLLTEKAQEKVEKILGEGRQELCVYERELTQTLGL